jgi:hypothetical protein
MTKGGSTTAMLPIAESVDDKMVPAISAVRTEIADFLVQLIVTINTKYAPRATGGWPPDGILMNDDFKRCKASEACACEGTSLKTIQGVLLP